MVSLIWKSYVINSRNYPRRNRHAVFIQLTAPLLHQSIFNLRELCVIWRIKQEWDKWS